MQDHPIRTARTRQDMTLDQLAEAAGVSVATVSRIERGLQQTRIETYQAIGRALGVDWWTLVDNQEQTT